MSVRITDRSIRTKGKDDGFHSPNGTVSMDPVITDKIVNANNQCGNGTRFAAKRCTSAHRPVAVYQLVPIHIYIVGTRV